LIKIDNLDSPIRSISLNLKIRVLGVDWQVDGKIVSEIGRGLLVLVGLLDSDTDVDSEFMFVSTSLNLGYYHCLNYKNLF